MRSGLFVSIVLFASLTISNSQLAVAGLNPQELADLALKIVEAGIAMDNANTEASGGADGPPQDPGAPNAPTPEYNPADALATDCFGDEACRQCMQPAIDLANEAYEVLATNHAWKKWTAQEYKRMDALATAASGLNKYSKLAYALKKSRDVLPAKVQFEKHVAQAQTTTLASLRSAFEKIGRCEQEHLGQDNFTSIALMGWQIMKVKYE